MVAFELPRESCSLSDAPYKLIRSAHEAGLCLLTGSGNPETIKQVNKARPSFANRGGRVYACRV